MAHSTTSTVSHSTSLIDDWAGRIRRGDIPPGHRMPTVRRFAAQHGIAIATASKVYRQLEALGLIVGEPGRGTFVRERQERQFDALATAPRARSAPTSIVDLSFSYPDTPEADALLRSSLHAMLTHADLSQLLQPLPIAGLPDARAAFASHLALRGLETRPDELVLVAGAQQGLACAVASVLKAGDLVVADALTYPGFTVLAQTQGLELQGLPWTEHGPDLHALELILQQRPVKALFTMPTLHNPTGWIMSLESRQHLVELARRYKIWLIEDGTYAFLVDPAPPPLQSLAPERTIYVSSLSKSVAGGLRVGCLVAPPSLIPRVERIVRTLTWSQSALPVHLATNWLRDGTVARLEQAKRRAAQAKQRLAAECLQGLSFQAYPQSFFVWITLPESVRAEPVTSDLADQGILLAPSSAFAISKPVPHAVRLNLAAPPLPDLKRALLAVRATLDAHACA